MTHRAALQKMGLMARSLDANLEFVTAHHVRRIMMNVGLAAASLRWTKND